MSDTSPRPGPVLLRNGRVHTPADAGAQAMLVDGGTVAWVGSDAAAAALDPGSATRVVDLGGALVTPAFVDAHAHCLDTGIQMSGLDLVGVASGGALLDAVAAAARRLPPGATVLGHGWDDAVPGFGPLPTLDELTRAAGDRPVYLSRVDVHSALVSWPLVEAAELRGLAGWDPSGVVRTAAHHAARAHARSLPGTRRREFHEAALRAAAAAGIGTVHEMSGPDIAGAEDLAALVGTAPAVGVRVVAYWARLAGDVSGRAGPTVAEAVAEAGVAVAGLAGDLVVDGSIGSRTAAFRKQYADSPTRGLRYLDGEQIAGHVAACGAVGVQAGFHVIGDAALDAVVEGLDRAAREHGEAVVRRARIRLEHVEAADDAQVAALVRHAATASVQPAFDAAWGGPDGMYARRLGERGTRLNRLATLAAAGVPLAFGSDSPVTPFDPWGAVAAATRHRTAGESISARAAFAAHTRGAHRAAGPGDGGGGPAGVLAPGAEATYAVWRAGELAVRTPDGRVQAWSTDPRAGVPPLPDLSGGARPACLRTVVAGVQVHDSGDLG